jgi:hypothetical protein
MPAEDVSQLVGDDDAELRLGKVGDECGRSKNTYGVFIEKTPAPSSTRR